MSSAVSLQRAQAHATVRKPQQVDPGGPQRAVVERAQCDLPGLRRRAGNRARPLAGRGQHELPALERVRQERDRLVCGRGALRQLRRQVEHGAGHQHQQERPEQPAVVVSRSNSTIAPMLPRVTALALIVLLCSSCGFKPEPTGALPAYPQTVRDALGRQVRIDTAPHRIVSLDPGMTAALYSIGAEKLLVGRSGLETYPKQSLHLPVMATDGQPDLKQIQHAQADVVLVPRVDGAHRAGRRQAAAEGGSRGLRGGRRLGQPGRERHRRDGLDHGPRRCGALAGRLDLDVRRPCAAVGGRPAAGPHLRRRRAGDPRRRSRSTRSA